MIKAMLALFKIEDKNRRLPNTLEKNADNFTKITEDFPNISENYRRMPTIFRTFDLSLFYIYFFIYFLFYFFYLFSILFIN